MLEAHYLSEFLAAAALSLIVYDTLICFEDEVGALQCGTPETYS